MSKVKAESSGATNLTSLRRKAEVGTKGEQSTADEFFRGVGFSIHREGPILVLKTLERLGLYISTQFKNGSDVKICLMQEKVVKPEFPELANEHSEHEKWNWDFKMTKIMKTKRVLEGYL